MKPHRLTRAAIALAFLIVGAFGSTTWSCITWAQSARTIKFVVAYAPGGGVDILARLLAEQIARTRGVTTVVENRPGAAGLIAADAVLRAPADGNTLLFTTQDPLVVTPHLRKLMYDPLVGFEPVCKLVDTPPVVVVNNTSPYRTIAEFIDGARSKPGDFTVASVGPGGAYQIAVEMLKRAAGAPLTYVPYSSSAPAISALLGGHVTAVLAAYPNAAEQIRAGQLRALAAATRTRAEGLADVPTAAEYGYADFALDIWFGVIAPAKTPKQAILQLSEWLSAAMQIAEVREKLVTLGLYPSGTCGSDFSALLRQQSDDFGRVIREADIKAQ